MKCSAIRIGYIVLSAIVAWTIHSEVRADQCERGSLRAYVFSVPGIKTRGISGANGSNICIFQDVSGSMAGAGGGSIGQGFVDGITSGAPGATVSQTGDELGCSNAGSKQWSLLCMGLQQAIQACCQSGCNMVVVSDGCSNHRNPFLAKADQECFNDLMSSLSNSMSSTLITAPVTGTVNASPGNLSGNYTLGPWNKNTSPSDLTDAALFVLTLASQH